jgi:receptor protein-tyrosine kinase
MVSRNEQAFRKWWWLVVVTVVVGFAGALVSLHFAKPEYQASCKLFVAGRPDSGTGEGYQAALFAQARVAAYLDLIKGARVAEGAINGLGIDIPTEDLQRRITANAAAESVIMTVGVVDSQPQKSADLVNAVCLSFLAVAADAEGANPLVNVRIIEYAKAPEYPIGPGSTRYLTVGGLAGFMAGLGLVMLLGRIRRRGDSTGYRASAGVPADDDEQPATSELSAVGTAEQFDNAGSHRRRDMTNPAP